MICGTILSARRHQVVESLAARDEREHPSTPDPTAPSSCRPLTRTRIAATARGRGSREKDGDHARRSNASRPEDRHAPGCSGLGAKAGPRRRASAAPTTVVCSRKPTDTNVRLRPAPTGRWSWRLRGASVPARPRPWPNSWISVTVGTVDEQCNRTTEHERRVVRGGHEVVELADHGLDVDRRDNDLEVGSGS